MASAPAGQTWPDQPVILEINTWVWLNERARTSGRATQLGNLTDEDWDSVLLPGMDAVWLMGVWARSPAGSVIARTETGVRRELEDALPDLTDEDVVGSPYSVRAYTVDPRLGGNEGLAAARAQLAARGIRLLVDFVPNHVARDHAWVSARPEYLIQASADQLAREPTHYIPVGGNIVALGRDPYFPPWTDVVQLNAFAAPLRQATADTLAAIAQQADGVRCDMAMLLLNDVFARTWGELAGPVPDSDFWPDIIASVKAANPGFLFIAEAYWDLEPQLLDQGFDYCYDKRLYDRLVDRDAAGLRTHLTAAASYQERMVRFLENHDEPRSAQRLPDEYLAAAAVAVVTLPGAVLLYEGQAEARHERPPVQLGRRPVETPDAQVQQLYRSLLSSIRDTQLRTGCWTLLDIEPAAPDAAVDGLLAWAWERSGSRWVVVLNLAGQPRTGRVRLPWSDLEGRQLTFAEVLETRRYEHDGSEVAAQGLYVHLAGGEHHFLSL